jgi:hypothetical protein
MSLGLKESGMVLKGVVLISQKTFGASTALKTFSCNDISFYEQSKCSNAMDAYGVLRHFSLCKKGNLGFSKCQISSIKVIGRLWTL